jgi:hypothetical protein
MIDFSLGNKTVAVLSEQENGGDPPANPPAETYSFVGHSGSTRLSSRVTVSG